MNSQQLPEIVQQSFTKADLNKLIPKEGIGWIDQFKAFVNIVPWVGGLATQEIQNFQDYKAAEFCRKYTMFIYGIEPFDEKARTQFCKEVEETAKDYSGNVIMGIVDRLDNIHKLTILANLTNARIKGLICIEDFFRLSSMLERIPYVDLYELPKYQQDYYDESGDTELLFASGVLIQTVIDAKKGDQYVLSRLGRKLVIFGLNIQLDTEQPIGKKEINATNTLTWTKVGEIDDSQIEDVISRKLEQKKYEELDQEMFDYDVASGK